MQTRPLTTDIAGAKPPITVGGRAPIDGHNGYGAQPIEAADLRVKKITQDWGCLPDNAPGLRRAVAIACGGR